MCNRGLYTVVNVLSDDLLLKDWYCCGNGGTGGTSAARYAGLVRGVPLLKLSPAAAAANVPSSVPDVPGRRSTPEKR